jgi:hypothetical protein
MLHLKTVLFCPIVLLCSHWVLPDVLYFQRERGVINGLNATG